VLDNLDKGIALIPSVDNVLSVYRSASPSQIEEGMSWYVDAHNFCKTLDSNVERAAGIVAALSPNNNWENNKVMAERLYSQGHGERCGLGANVSKAMRIFEGESPLDVLGGNKVRAFFRSIAYPADASVQPVIDRHAFDIAVGKRTDNRTRGILDRKGVYESFAEVYIEAAQTADIGSAQMQAVTWVAWREIV